MYKLVLCWLDTNVTARGEYEIERSEPITNFML